ncbi:hypothetical protein CKA32_005282 [Geitlerinema sp. FC II]|nr:hypothetical protein CKA32_005282 [Geitlerinema sp. FC II]
MVAIGVEPGQQVNELSGAKNFSRLGIDKTDEICIKDRARSSASLRCRGSPPAIYRSGILRPAL